MHWHLPSPIHESLTVHGNSTSQNSGDLSRYPSMNIFWFGFLIKFRVAQRETFCFWITSTSSLDKSRMAFRFLLCTLLCCRLPFKISLTSKPWGFTLHHCQNKGKDPEQGKSPVKLFATKLKEMAVPLLKVILRAVISSPIYPLLLIITLLLQPGLFIMRIHTWQSAVNKWIYLEVFSAYWISSKMAPPK